MPVIGYLGFGTPDAEREKVIAIHTRINLRGDRPMSKPNDGKFPWTIKIALSGGEHRAAAYALAALLYLVHSG
jgi:hypothetical protein